MIAHLIGGKRTGVPLIRYCVLLFLLAGLTGCQAAQPGTVAASPPLASPTPAGETLATVLPSPIPPTSTPKMATAIPSASPTPQPSATRAPQVCSPLQDLSLQQLPAWVVNPFNPPRTGSDDPHQGLDLAQVDSRTGIALTGWPVQAVLDGSVAAVIKDRFPYGNAILVESRLEQLPLGWQQALPAPTEANPYQGPLTCPAILADPGWQTQVRSVYILYAHLESHPAFEAGQPIHCGQLLGQIGVSGNALNPHLHLEMRAGPGLVRFESMAHYTGSASNAEMSAYCTWRVGGQFQLLDPAIFLLMPASPNQ